jgi:hypothetical protein
MAAVLSMISMIALLTQISLPAIELLAFWSAVGASLYVVSRRMWRRASARRRTG